MSNRRNARILKTLSLLCLGLVVFSLLLVHQSSYEPGVSFVLFYLSAAVVVTAAFALLLLAADQFIGGFCAAAYVFYAAFVSLMVFFSGGISSELHALYWPLLLAAALHGSWRIGLTALLSVIIGYVLAMLPAISDGAVDAGDPALMFFRFGAFLLSGLFVVFAARSLAVASSADEGYFVDEDGSLFLEMVAGEMEARRGEQVAVVLVDPGREVEDSELLLERVRSRVGEPVLLGEGPVFGVVLPGDERRVEGAARRALAAASSLGSEETRAGVAIHPHDAHTPGDLLAAAGVALEAAFEVQAPSAIVFAGQDSSGGEGPYRAAR